MIDNDDGYKVTFGSGELQMIMVMAQHPEKSYCTNVYTKGEMIHGHRMYRNHDYFEDGSVHDTPRFFW